MLGERTVSIVTDNTPILVGVGQLTQPVSSEKADWHSHADLAKIAVKAALADTGVSSEMIPKIDVVAAVKTFADSSPMHKCPFGKADNLPGAVANRIGIKAKHTIYDVLGGQSPQKLIGEFCEKLAHNKHEAVVLFGSEVIGHIRSASRSGEHLDWSEKVGGYLEDRGLSGGVQLISRAEYLHKLMMPAQFYGLMENARRAKLKKSVEDYRMDMAKEFAKLSSIAEGNEHAIDRSSHDAADLAKLSAENPMVVAPYPKRLMARDGVNQSAAVILTTVKLAKELRIDERKWVYLHGHADVNEKAFLERRDLSKSPAMQKSFEGAFEAAKITSEAIKYFDIYSCFPVVVSTARGYLSMDNDDERQLTVTGGLPFFGGPGNNYSMHAVCSMVERLREDTGSFGLVYANGGMMSKHSTGIYSTNPSVWRDHENTSLQAYVDQISPVAFEHNPNGQGRIETYTVSYHKGEAISAQIIGRLNDNDKRFLAVSDFQDSETFSDFINNDPLERTVYVSNNPRGNQFTFNPVHLKEIQKLPVTEFQSEYEFCKLERRGNVLIIAIDRPDVSNALHPPANEELQGIFNAYERDTDLWAAVLTATGQHSFSAGNDLKYMANGGEMWIPETGFAGLTHRQGRVKPVIAAVNGNALGGGLEIAMACDLIVSSDKAMFGLPEVKVGLIAAMGGIQRLTRQIGVKTAQHMILTGSPISADQALRLGLINAVVAPENVVTEALELAEKICDASPAAVRASLDLFNQSQKISSTEEAVAAHFDAFDKLLNSADFQEGPTAFAEKRKPVWTGL